MLQIVCHFKILNLLDYNNELIKLLIKLLL